MNKTDFSNLMETLQFLFKEMKEYSANMTMVDAKLSDCILNNKYTNNMGVMFDVMVDFLFGEMENLITWFIMERQIFNTTFDESFPIETVEDLINYISQKYPDYFVE